MSAWGKQTEISKGLFWTGLEKLFVQVVSFAQGVVLARLLCPEDFGLAAMLGIFLGLGATLADCGLGSALVVRKFADCGLLAERKALLWNLGVGGAIYLALCAAAPGIAAFYHQPALREIVWVMGLGIVLNAASCVPTARLTREMQFRKMSAANAASTLVAAAVAVVMALRGAGVWSVATLGVVQAGVRTACVWALARTAERADAARSAVAFRDLLRYGAGVMASGLIHSVYINLYELILGKMQNPAAVGLYNRGNGWVTAARNFVNPTIERVAFPVLAKTETRGMRFLALNIALLWPGLAVLWIWAPEIVSFVFGDQWLASVPCLRILICGQLFTPFGNIALNTLRARGRADLILRTDAVKKPLGLAALACGIPFGLVGICWAKVASDFFEAAADAWYAWRGKLPELEKAEGKEAPIDLVYLWYGKKDPPPGVEKCRASDNGELRWSLKSVDRFAPWFRRIFVLVNDGTEIPDWLSSHPRVSVLEHRQFIEPWALPLYNTAAIEMWIDRVPGLSERFVYGNDDYFFGRTVSPRDFFDGQGRIVYWHFPRGKLKDRRGSNYFDMLRYSRRILGTSEQCLPHHNFQGCLKSEIAAFRRRYPSETKASAGRRYRVGEQFCFDAFALDAVLRGRGVKRPSFGLVRLRRMLGLPAYESMYGAIEDRPFLAWMESNRPKMFCLNDTEKSTDEDRVNVAGVLERMLS